MRGERERIIFNAAIEALGRELGHQDSGSRIHKAVDNALQIAIERKILAVERGALRLSARNIEQYERNLLKEQFLASLSGGPWVERDEALRPLPPDGVAPSQAIDRRNRAITDQRSGPRKARRTQRVPDPDSRMRSLKRNRTGPTRAVSGITIDDEILRRFRAALDELYGDRIERVVLFGSRARGDAHEASDYDIAVFLKDLTDRWREFHRLADLRTEILADTGAFIEARPFRAGGYRERTPLMDEIRREGIDF